MEKILAYIDQIKNTYILSGLFLISISVRLLYLKVLGSHIGQDSQFYSNAASILLDTNFNFLELLNRGFPPYYWSYPAILALFQNNIQYIIYFQIFAGALSSVFLYFIVSKIFNKLTGIFAALMFGLFFEIFQWDTYLLTDSLFVSFIITAIFLYFLSQQKKKNLYRILLSFVLLLLLFLRPTFLPLLGALILTVSWKWQRHNKIIFFAAGVTVAFLVVLALLRQEPGAHLSIQGYAHYFVSLFQSGIIVRDRSEFIFPTYFTPELSFTNLFLFLQIFLAKLVSFWSPTAKKFSLSHIFLNLVTFIPLYIFGLIGIFKSLRNLPQDELAKKITLFSFSCLLSFWIFHSLTEIDFDWRYRMPALPFLIIFASFGLSSSLSYFEKSCLLKHQIIRFLIIGGVSTIVDYAFLNCFSILLHFSLPWAVFYGFVSGSLIGYFLHSRFTFQFNTEGQEMLKLSLYLSISITNLAITEFLMHLLTIDFGLHYNLGKFITLIFVATTSFSMSKWWIFRKNSKNTAMGSTVNPS